MGFFKKKKKDISFEADSYYDEMVNGNADNYQSNNYQNTYNNEYNANASYNNLNSNYNNNQEFNYDNVTNKKFNYRRANKKVMSQEQYRRMVDEEYDKQLLQKKKKVKTIVFSIGIVYLFVLVIGIFSTPFFTRNGQKQGDIVTLKILEERESYNALREQYIELSKLLVQVNTIDEKLKTATPDDYFDLSSQYQAVLPLIDKDLTKAKAMKVDAKYAPLKNSVATTYNDLAIYLQKMGTALNNSSDATFKEAVSWNKQTYSDYNSLKTNLYQFSEKVKIKEKDNFWNLLGK